MGLQAMAGLSAGIRAGQAGVVSSMVAAVQAAIQAAKDEMGIKSPSTVFQDEVGRMTMKGWGRGVVMESQEQSRVVANAARFLTESAKTSAVAYNTSDNRRTYQQQSSVILTGNTFQIRNDQDISALAREMALLLQRQHGARGARRG